MPCVSMNAANASWSPCSAASPIHPPFTYDNARGSKKVTPLSPHHHSIMNWLAGGCHLYPESTQTLVDSPGDSPLMTRKSAAVKLSLRWFDLSDDGERGNCRCTPARPVPRASFVFSKYGSRDFGVVRGQRHILSDDAATLSSKMLPSGRSLSPVGSISRTTRGSPPSKTVSCTPNGQAFCTARTETTGLTPEISANGG